MIRAVIDTNVLVSALLSATGNEALILLAIHQGIIRPCFSMPILSEYETVLRRPRFGFSTETVTSVLAVIELRGEFVEPAALSVVSPDPADTKFLHCALTAKADFLVTGNRRDFPASPYGATYVVNATEMLDHITLEL